MIKLIVALILLAQMYPNPGPGTAAPHSAGTSVKAYQCQACSVNSGVKYASNTSGDMIVMAVVYDETLTITSITDTAGNTWSTTPDCTTSPVVGFNVSWFHKAGIVSATNNTISVTASGTVDYFTVLTDENTYSAYDACGTAASGTGTAIGATVTTISPTGIIYGYGGADADIAAVSPSTLASEPSPATGDLLVKQTSTGTGDQSVSMSQAAADSWGATAISYK